ncbi:MaoC family dehydratase [Thalassotalea euphylliae]|uniref:MaoC family dehydratase n=1 Tax=Thalassotalea euphylliae TaxID=1655234 RepID=A0A3E0U218_9GAMM|nr:MaoC family dehydratase [Thalassotalea euphylliae]REL30769.1 MaoC family dehydratase [Thalassotalea euphylliae]
MHNKQHQVTAEQIIEFAQQFDPQPFHTNEEQAKSSFFKGLVASGWHTAAITMKLIVASDAKPAGGLIGAGVDKLRFNQAVRPGDSLQAKVTVIEAKASSSKPEQGLITIAVSATNQEQQEVCSYVSTIVVPKRPNT